MDQIKTLHRPVLSPDSDYLAIITPDQELSLLDLKNTRLVHKIQTNKSIKSLLSEATILRWAPESIIASDSDSQYEILRTWLLVAGGSRLVVFELDLPCHSRSRSDECLVNMRVLVDYQFEPQYGKLAIASFVLDHNQAVVMFEMNVQASLIFFDKLQRDDIPQSKFSSSQGFAQSENQDRLALLLRSGSQDQIAVFALDTGTFKQSLIFLPDTIDAQGLVWSPDRSPVLAVWDSAVYGPKISFFTALGHPLRQLDLTFETYAHLTPSQDVPGVGVTCVDWAVDLAGRTLLIAGIEESRIILRYQDHKSMEARTGLLQHHAVTDGSRCLVWQQTSAATFDHHTVVFELPIDSSSEVSAITINSRANVVATKVDTVPKVAWIWKLDDQNLAGVIILQHEIKQILWHPSLENVLAIVTNEKSPSIYILHDLQQAPTRLILPLGETLPTTKWEARWIQNIGARRCPLLISSTKQLDVGFLHLVDGTAVYESVLIRDELSKMLDEEESSIMDTPSKPGQDHSQPIDRILDVAGYLWSATVSTEKW